MTDCKIQQWSTTTKTTTGVQTEAYHQVLGEINGPLLRQTAEHKTNQQQQLAAVQTNGDLL